MRRGQGRGELGPGGVGRGSSERRRGDPRGGRGHQRASRVRWGRAETLSGTLGLGVGWKRQVGLCRFGGQRLRCEKALGFLG